MGVSRGGGIILANNKNLKATKLELQTLDIHVNNKITLYVITLKHANTYMERKIC